MNEVLTRSDAVVARRFPEKTVQLPHIAQRGSRPADSCYAGLYLFPEGRNKIGILCKVVECIVDNLG